MSSAVLATSGRLTLTPDCSLPSLFAAIHEEPYASGKPGFGQWPKTKWWWAGALATDQNTHVLKIHKGKNLYLTTEAAGLVVPVSLRELARAERGDFGPVAVLVVTHLADAGPSSIEDLKTELGIDSRSLRAVRRRLESLGALVSRSVTIEHRDGHTHSSQLLRIDQADIRPVHGGIKELLFVAIRAAVLAPVGELRQWFTWPIDQRFVEDLVVEGRILRIGDRVAVAT